MKQRIDYYAASPETLQAMLALEEQVKAHCFDPALYELVKIRVSQLNGCAYCLDMHTHEARAAGETEARLHLLAAWRESPLYTRRERAALAWAEAVTLVATRGVPDDVFTEAAGEFNESELARLTLAINTINSWNRLAVSSRMVHPVVHPAIA
ncbi:MAG TPA: carboxymuconolactone decarboxylase family protein [Rariglobus sp.]